MVKASDPGNITTSNASNIPTAHGNRVIHFRWRSYRWSGFTASRRHTMARGLCWGWANPARHFSSGMTLSEIRHWQCDANHENSLWNLDAIRRTSSRLNSLAADLPARLLLVIDMASACPL